VVWPSFDEEIGAWRPFLKGRVLNAGCGDRDLSPWVDGEVVNQDIPGGLHNANVHIHSPLMSIPVKDGHFDVVFCNAVLEHVEDPRACVFEFHRVLRSGGYLYLCVPFMQPEHPDPSDFQRLPRQGLAKLVADSGFAVERIEAIHSVYHTLGWLIERWLTSRRCPSYLLLRLILFPLLRYKTRHSRTCVESMASAYRVLARKEGASLQVR
jgi:SAM-dependent methyltransferase